MPSWSQFHGDLDTLGVWAGECPMLLHALQAALVALASQTLDVIDDSSLWPPSSGFQTRKLNLGSKSSSPPILIALIEPQWKEPTHKTCP